MNPRNSMNWKKSGKQIHSIKKILENQNNDQAEYEREFKFKSDPHSKLKVIPQILVPACIYKLKVFSKEKNNQRRWKSGKFE